MTSTALAPILVVLVALLAIPAPGLTCDTGGGDPPAAKVKGKGR